MEQYLKKTISPKPGMTLGAWVGKELVVNLETGKAHIRLSGNVNGQEVADGVQPTMIDKIWQKDAVLEMESAQALYADIVADMVTNPDSTGNEDFIGAVLEDIPDPS